MAPARHADAHDALTDEFTAQEVTAQKVTAQEVTAQAAAPDRRPAGRAPLGRRRRPRRAAARPALRDLAETVVAELLAFLTLGLVRSWGEVHPRRLPLLGGRPVSRRGATAAALGGAAGLFALTGWYTYVAVSGLGRDAAGGHTEGTFQEVLFLVCYLPLAAWAPLLAAVAVAYSRRRRRTRA
ncbi:hypothetical protein ACF09C_10355 [Streptomyces sp. NPDC014870]|uniref:hypothetical protein n=1 Tax=Streptomyces sp. NPDC014870 TaxID=3364925 RepID=UPI0036FC9C27